MCALPSTVSESTRRLNPSLFGGSPAPQVEYKPRLKQNRGPELNKTETAFLLHLRAFECKEWDITPHALTFRLGNGVRYTPDIIANYHGIVRAYEVKGFMRDDAAVKLKCAAALFPWCSFWLASKDKREGWRIEKVMP